MTLTVDPLVSIIIPVHNQIGYLQSCVRSIRSADTKTDFEILVVDDKSAPESASEIDTIEGVRVIRNYENMGFLRSCNRGALNAAGNFIAFLNSDTEVTASWLDELVDVFERFPDAGLVGSKLIYPDGSLQECGGIVWNNATACNFGRGEAPECPEYNYTKTVDYVSGASLMIKKAFFIECGLFDCRYTPAYYEDTDLAFTVRSLGKEVYVEPKSVVIHHEGISNGTNLDSGIKKYQERNRLKFLEKWSDILANHHAAPGQDFLKRRDRSTAKSRILIIDHYVPTYDKDAGSRCINMYIKLLVDLGLSVTFLPHNRGKPLPYSDELERIGIEILYGTYQIKNWKKWMQKNLNEYDFVFLSRPNIAIEYIAEIRKYSDAKLIFFGHDIHHLRLQRELEIGGLVEKREIGAVRVQELEVWKSCDALLYPSEEEVQYCVANSGSSKAIEVPIFFFEKPTDSNTLSFEEREGILFVANFNHPPNRDGVHWFFDTIYPTLDKLLGSPQITIVGSAIPHDIRNYESDRIKILSDLSDSELKEEYANSRIAIAPLRFGAGVKGKVLEALRNKLPIVTTSIGAQGIPGLAACASIEDVPENFANACLKLYTEKKTWLSFHDRSTEILLKKFSYSNARRIMESLLFG